MRHPQSGQAVVETALVIPILLFILLGTIEAGSLGARWITWTRLAGDVADHYAATSSIPDWFDVEAADARCGDAALAIDADAVPIHVVMGCVYAPSAVNGFTPTIYVEAIAVPVESPMPD